MFEKKVLILGGNSDISISVILKLVEKCEIEITSRNTERLKSLFKENKNTKIRSLDLINRKQIKQFIDQRVESFDLIFCFSGTINDKNTNNMILSNYLGVKYFMELYFLKFGKKTKFIVLTSVAALRKKNKNLYIKLKKKLTFFLKEKINEGYKIYNIMPGYIDTKLTSKKNLIFKLLSTRPDDIASEILIIKDKNPGQYIVPIYWKYIIKFYNLFF
jgi:NADP-dependent 3-hydroxy acid dehydrogenase YdfG